MYACTRCGRKHTDPEKALGKILSCTEVKQFWSDIRSEHQALYGHWPHFTTNESGDWICFKCQRKIEIAQVETSERNSNISDL